MLKWFWGGGGAFTKVVNSLFAHYSQYLGDEAIHRSYLVSLVFGKNCRKIGVNTSRPESSICVWGEGAFPYIMNIY